MISPNLTPPARWEHRRARLPAPNKAIFLSVDYCQDTDPLVCVNYRGTAEALIEAGCATPATFGPRPRGEGRLRQRLRGRGVPRFRITHRFCAREGSEIADALTLPGVRELFPEGFPEPTPEVQEAPYRTAASWREEAVPFAMGFLMTGRLDRLDEALAERPGGNTFSFDFGREGAQQLEEACRRILDARTVIEHLIRGARVVDLHRPALRLVVDNADGQP